MTTKDNCKIYYPDEKVNVVIIKGSALPQDVAKTVRSVTGHSWLYFTMPYSRTTHLHHRNATIVHFHGRLCKLAHLPNPCGNYNLLLMNNESVPDWTTTEKGKGTAAVEYCYIHSTIVLFHR